MKGLHGAISQASAVGQHRDALSRPSQILGKAAQSSKVAVDIPANAKGIEKVLHVLHPLHRADPHIHGGAHVDPRIKAVHDLGGNGGCGGNDLGQNAFIAEEFQNGNHPSFVRQAQSIVAVAGGIEEKIQLHAHRGDLSQFLHQKLHGGIIRIAVLLPEGASAAGATEEGEIHLPDRRPIGAHDLGKGHLPLLRDAIPHAKRNGSLRVSRFHFPALSRCQRPLNTSRFRPRSNPPARGGGGGTFHGTYS